MRYRAIGSIITLTLSLLVASLPVNAQPARKITRVGLLSAAATRSWS